GILGTADIPSFITAVENEDEKFLTGFPGVGKKTARQIILDLKGKLTTAFSITPIEEKKMGKDTTIFKEAGDALKSLGYTEKEVSSVMPTLRKLDVTQTDEVIRKALALLMKN